MAFHNSLAGYYNKTGRIDHQGRTLTEDDRKAANPHHPLWRADAVYAMNAIAAALTPDYGGCLNDAWKLDEVRSMRGLAEAAEAALAVVDTGRIDAMLAAAGYCDAIETLAADADSRLWACRTQEALARLAAVIGDTSAWEAFDFDSATWRQICERAVEFTAFWEARR